MTCSDECHILLSCDDNKDDGMFTIKITESTGYERIFHAGDIRKDDQVVKRLCIYVEV